MTIPSQQTEIASLFSNCFVGVCTACRKPILCIFLTKHVLFADLQPIVSAFIPVEGPVEGNVQVTVTGQYMHYPEAGLLCVWTLDGKSRNSSALMTNSSAMGIICKTPRLEPGNVTLSLYVEGVGEVKFKYKSAVTKFTVYPTLLITDISASSVSRFNALTGNFMDFFVQPKSGGLETPYGIGFGPDENFYVSDDGSSSVLQYDGQHGAFLKVFCKVPGSPRGLVFHYQELFVCSAYNNAIYRYNGFTGSAKVSKAHVPLNQPVVFVMCICSFHHLPLSSVCIMNFLCFAGTSVSSQQSLFSMEFAV